MDDDTGVAGDGERVGAAESEAGDRGPLGDAPRSHAPQVVVRTDPTAGSCRAADLTDDLGRVGGGVESLPRSVIEAGAPIRPVDDERFVPHERHRGTVAEAEVDIGRRRRVRPSEYRPVDRPHDAVGIDDRRRCDVDMEFQRLADERKGGGLTIHRVDHGQPRRSDPGDRLSAAERLEADRSADPEVGGLDRLDLRGRVVHEVRQRSAFGHADLLTAALGIDPRHGTTAVAVDEHNGAGRAVHEPVRRPGRRCVDRGQSVGAEEHHHAHERDDDRDGGGDGLAPGHSGCGHRDLFGGTADGVG